MAQYSHKNSRKADHLQEYCFKPGQSGNPGGRPKSRTIRELLTERLDELDPRTKKTYGRLLVEAIVRAALRGNVHAFNAIADRIEGKPPAAIELCGPSGNGIPIEYGKMSLEEIEKRILEIVENGRKRAADAIAKGEARIESADKIGGGGKPN